MKKKVLLPVLLAAMAFPLVLHQNPISVNAEFIGEYTKKADYVAHAVEVNSQMADEGFVLLKNDGFLPMNGDEMVSVVGKASTNLARGGAGSGSGSTLLFSPQAVRQRAKNIEPKTNSFLFFIVIYPLFPVLFYIIFNIY